MTKILAIAWKDLRSTLRNRAGAGDDAGRAARRSPPCWASPSAAAAAFDIAATKVVVANLDKGGAEPGQNAGAAIQKILASKDLSDVLDTTTATSAAAARKAVDDGKAAVAVIVPEDFSAVVYGSDPAAESRVELYENPTSRDRRLHRRGCRRPGAGRLQRRPRGRRRRRRPALDAAATPPSRTVAARAAEQFSHAGRRLGRAADQPSARRRSAGTEKEVSVTGSILSGMMVFFMFFGAANVARTILTEDRDGTMPRLFTTPTRHGTIIGGKFVAVFVTVLVQAVVLLDRRPPDLRHPLGSPRRRRPAHRGRPPAWPAASRCSSSRSPRRRPRRAPSAPASTSSSPCSAATSPAPPRPAAPTPSSRSSRPTAGCSTAGTRPCAAAARRTSAGRCSSRSASRWRSSSSPCCKMRRRFA